MTGTVTYRQLDQLLLTLGFPAAQVKKSCRSYRHSESGTVILLTDDAPTKPIRIADLVSIRRHLVEKGLMQDTAFDEFASTGSIPIGT